MVSSGKQFGSAQARVTASGDCTYKTFRQSTMTTLFTFNFVIYDEEAHTLHNTAAQTRRNIQI
jgi:hypothetical protein